MCWSLVWDCSSKCTHPYSVIHPENVLISSVRLFLKMCWSLQCDVLIPVPQNLLIPTVWYILEMCWSLVWLFLKMCWSLVWDFLSMCWSLVWLFLKMYWSLVWYILKMCWSLVVWDYSSKCTHPYSVIHPENVLISSVRLFLKMFSSLQCDTSWKCADL